MFQLQWVFQYNALTQLLTPFIKYALGYMSYLELLQILQVTYNCVCVCVCLHIYHIKQLCIRIYLFIRKQFSSMFIFKLTCFKSNGYYFHRYLTSYNRSNFEFNCFQYNCILSCYYMICVIMGEHITFFIV